MHMFLGLLFKMLPDIEAGVQSLFKQCTIDALNMAAAAQQYERAEETFSNSFFRFIFSLENLQLESAIVLGNGWSAKAPISLKPADLFQWVLNKEDESSGMVRCLPPLASLSELEMTLCGESKELPRLHLRRYNKQLSRASLGTSNGVAGRPFQTSSAMRCGGRP